MKELEQIKAVLLALQHKATQFDDYYNKRVAFMKQRMGKKDAAAAAAAWKAQNKMGQWAQESAAGELARLDGWMKSLNESEMGLHALLSEGLSGPSAYFAAKRSAFLQAEASKWNNRMFWLLTR